MPQAPGSARGCYIAAPAASSRKCCPRTRPPSPGLRPSRLLRFGFVVSADSPSGTVTRCVLILFLFFFFFFFFDLFSLYSIRFYSILLLMLFFFMKYNERIEGLALRAAVGSAIRANPEGGRVSCATASEGAEILDHNPYQPT